MPQAVILSGGPAHDFPALTDRLAHIFAQVGVLATITTEPEQVPGLLAGADLFVVNALRWQMRAARYEHLREVQGYSPSREFRSAVTSFVSAGGGMIGMHTASICFDDWPAWARLLGARWDWDTSFHPPACPTRVRVRSGEHPIVDGLPDSFDTDDEIYASLELQSGIDPLLLGNHTGAEHPLLWVREVGRGRVVHNSLGHHLQSYEASVLRTVVRRSALWCLRADDDKVRTA